MEKSTFEVMEQALYTLKDEIEAKEQIRLKALSTIEMKLSRFPKWNSSYRQFLENLKAILE